MSLDGRAEPFEKAVLELHIGHSRTNTRVREIDLIRWAAAINATGTR